MSVGQSQPNYLTILLPVHWEIKSYVTGSFIPGIIVLHFASQLDSFHFAPWYLNYSSTSWAAMTGEFQHLQELDQSLPYCESFRAHLVKFLHLKILSLGQVELILLDLATVPWVPWETLLG